MENRLCFVQLLHPGIEHGPGTATEWNIGKHQRKFMKCLGRYVSGASGKEKQGETVFWGEWEPPAGILRRIDEPLSEGPTHIYEPYYKDPQTGRYDGLQNTDPFVFGRRFKYSICLQNRKRGPGQLRHLKEWSVILFGSHLNRKFVLDTVFVVGSYIDHQIGNYKRRLRGKVTALYWMATLSPLYEGAAGTACRTGSSTESYRLYFGTSFKERRNETFSFFPCKLYEEGSKGFPRPEIRIQNVISDGQRQGYRYVTGSIERVRDLWKQVVEQVENQGLLLGTFAELP